MARVLRDPAARDVEGARDAAEAREAGGGRRAAGWARVQWRSARAGGAPLIPAPSARAHTERRACLSRRVRSQNGFVKAWGVIYEATLVCLPGAAALPHKARGGMRRASKGKNYKRQRGTRVHAMQKSRALMP